MVSLEIHPEAFPESKQRMFALATYQVIRDYLSVPENAAFLESEIERMKREGIIL